MGFMFCVFLTMPLGRLGSNQIVTVAPLAFAMETNTTLTTLK
jgi:hypothetical protein